MRSWSSSHRATPPAARARTYGGPPPTASGKVRNPRTGGRGSFCVERVGEIVLVGVGRRGRARRDAELGEDVAHVAGDGPVADHELGGDLAVGPPRGDQGEHLQLAPGEPAGSGRRERLDEPAGTGGVRRGAQPPGLLAGGGELERGP